MKQMGVIHYVKKGSKWVEVGREVRNDLVNFFSMTNLKHEMAFDRAFGARIVKQSSYYEEYEVISPDKKEKIRFEGFGIAGREQYYK